MLTLTVSSIVPRSGGGCHSFFVSEFPALMVATGSESSAGLPAGNYRDRDLGA